MKILSKILLIIMIFILCITCNSFYVYADVTGDNDRGLPAIDSTLKPTPNLANDPTKDGEAADAVVKVLKVLKGVGIIAVVIGIALIGFNTILGSASEKAIAQEKYVGIVIAAIIITAGSTIAQFLIEAAENL